MPLNENEEALVAVDLSELEVGETKGNDAEVAQKTINAIVAQASQRAIETSRALQKRITDDPNAIPNGVQEMVEGDDFLGFLYPKKKRNRMS